ncbi:S8 family serine peptidase [Herbidospora sp. NEAU-GS84]|uniref:S8 family serine peptidase n=1 Tax=Herbidospora solisilvae TaxID=2696284 RepID=A0A7C9J6X9_9ACTN|nr:S8 family serine peptidase [Herbidospora solisilvae]NAS26327.1 S8 family serine peptidase [Herbidospora solisilvae]
MMITAIRGRRPRTTVYLLLLGLLGWTVTTGPADAEPAPSPKIAAEVRAEAADGGETSFWVRFARKADLSAATGPVDVIDARKAVATSSQKDVLALAEAAGADHTAFWISNTVLVTGDRALIDRIAARPEVTAIEPDEPIELHTAVARRAGAMAGVEWNVEKIRADDVWSGYGTKGEGIVVAGIDTGVQWNHPALVGSYRGGAAGNHDYNWYNPEGGCPSSAPCDVNGHGTHTMGTMVGDDGVNQVGVAPGVKWIAAKACPSTTCTAASLLLAGQWMLAPTDASGNNPRPDLAPDVINNSWGGMGYSEWYSDVVYSWTQAGIFPAFSIGNDGPGCETGSSPGAQLGAYATGAFDANDVIAPFSSRGSGMSWFKPDLAAPGVDVRSSVPGGGYGVASGTSMASPHTAATVALIWSEVPRLRGMVDLTRTVLNDSAVPMPDTSCASAGDVNAAWGNGRLDAYAAVQLALANPVAPGTELPLAVGYNVGLPGTPDHWGYMTVDGDPATYWEVPSDRVFANINLAFTGGRRTFDKVTVTLPAGEPARTLRFAVRAAYEGFSDYSTVVPEADYPFNPATGNKVTVTLPPVHGCCVALQFPAGPWSPTLKIAEIEAFSATGKNAAQGRPVTASHVQGYVPGNAVDGNTATYWESNNNAFPQTYTVDLGAPVKIHQAELTLPPGWPARTQTIAVSGGNDGSTYVPIVASRAYTFGASPVTVGFNMTNVRYVRLTFTGNTAWPAAQLSELRLLAS